MSNFSSYNKTLSLKIIYPRWKLFWSHWNARSGATEPLPIYLDPRPASWDPRAALRAATPPSCRPPAKLPEHAHV